MTISVIIMIIIGLIFIFASYFISEKLTKKEENRNLDLMIIDEDYEFSERELNIIKNKIEDIIAEHARTILYETDDSLSNMSNEKTMALGDYAVAVCEEIEKNHKEVMFLYSMLDDKQKEIMVTVKQVDQAKKELDETNRELERTKKELFEIKKEIEEKISKLTKKTINSSEYISEPIEKKTAIEQLSALSKKNKEESSSLKVKKEERVEDVATENIEATSQEKQDDLKEQSVEKEQKQIVDNKNEDLSIDLDEVFAELDQEEINFDEVLEEEFKENENLNDIILELYKNGNSIIDIAKQLGLGVGEVKLVIDLYQGE